VWWCESFIWIHPYLVIACKINIVYSAMLALVFFQIVSSLIAAIIISEITSFLASFTKFAYCRFSIRRSFLIASRNVIVSISLIWSMESSSKVADGIESSSWSLAWLSLLCICLFRSWTLSSSISWLTIINPSLPCHYEFTCQNEDGFCFACQ